MYFSNWISGKSQWEKRHVRKNMKYSEVHRRQPLLPADFPFVFVYVCLCMCTGVSRKTGMCLLSTSSSWYSKPWELFYTAIWSFLFLFCLRNIPWPLKYLQNTLDNPSSYLQLFCINIIYLYYELHFISPPNSYVQLKPLGPSSVTRFEDGASKLVISFKMRILMCGQSQSIQCSIKKK